MTTTGSQKAKDQILIIGDCVIDETWYIDVKKISPEAPVPVGYLTSLEPVKTPGGASLAASYALKNEISSVLLTTVSNDNLNWLRDKGIEIYSFDTIKKDIVKTRFIDKTTNYHILRVDSDEISDNPTIRPAQMEEMLFNIFKDHNIVAIAVLDYRKGILIDPETCITLKNIAKEKSIPLYVDTRGNTKKYKDYSMLKVNDKEFNAACAALGITKPTALMSILNLEFLIVTHGSKGASLYSQLPSCPPEVTKTPDLFEHEGIPDPTGAGDVFDVSFCYYYFIEGNSIEESLKKAVDSATTYAYEPISERLC